MLCRKIYQKNPWSIDQWWRWLYSAAAPPSRVALVEREKILNSVSRVQDPCLLIPERRIAQRNHHQREFLSIPLGIRWCPLTTQAATDLPVGGVVDVPLAQTGEGIAECELLKWFVLEGEEVEEFQPLCEVQSDKATIEITSRYKGKVSRVLHVPGNIVKVGETLLKMVIDENASIIPSIEAAENIVPQDSKINELDVANSMLKKEKFRGVLSTPAVRNFAKQLGVTIEDVLGTGDEGRILKEDILNYAARKGILKESSEILNEDSSTKQFLGDLESPNVSSTYGWEFEDRSLPLRGFHRTMAKSMTLAAKVPHFHYVEEVNCDALLDLRASFQNETSDLGLKFTFLPLLVKSLSMALSKYPLLNSCFNEESQEVTLKGSHNIGIAMATPNSLVVPNIKKAQSLSIVEDLDGSNYPLWKVKMLIYIKSIEEKAWLCVLDGWTPPTALDADGDNRIKPENAWTAEEHALIEGETHTTLSIKLEKKGWLQVNHLGVAAGVITPGRSTSPNSSSSICLNATTVGDSSDLENQEVDEDEVTLKSVQKMYEELYDDWIKFSRKRI